MIKIIFNRLNCTYIIDTMENIKNQVHQLFENF